MLTSQLEKLLEASQRQKPRHLRCTLPLVFIVEALLWCNAWEIWWLLLLQDVLTVLSGDGNLFIFQVVCATLGVDETVLVGVKLFLEFLGYIFTFPDLSKQELFLVASLVCLLNLFLVDFLNKRSKVRPCFVHPDYQECQTWDRLSPLVIFQCHLP